MMPDSSTPADPQGTPDQRSHEYARGSRGGSWRVVIWFPIIAIVAYFFAIHIIRPPDRGGLRPGETAPAVTAAGWLNGERPTAADLSGKVVVVDAWFAACPPCRKKAPELVELYQRFHERGVVFIGLTPDSQDDLPNIQRFLENTGIPWPNGYGAVETLEKFLTDGGYFPSAWVIGADGKVVWNEDSPGRMDEAIEQALSSAR
jgi:thiol-disulfide isomerase/thioredoxin